MNGRILIRCIGALASSTILWCAASPLQAQDSQRKPNILFIVSDDTGYGDLGPYGGVKVVGCRPRTSTNWLKTA